jgi:hypothetical protein
MTSSGFDVTRGRENNHQNYVTNEGGASLRPRTLAMSAPADAASAVEEKPKAPDPPKRFVRNQVRHRGAPPALSMRLAFRHSAAADASALHGRMRLLGARSSLVV